MHMNDIVKSGYKNFYLLSSLNLNNLSNKIQCNTHFVDASCSLRFQCCVSGTTLIDNFICHLFNRIEARKHNKILDERAYPGIILAQLKK